MVAYSFQSRFVDPIVTGRKCQTIRAVGKRRHAATGDALQLYTGMRTRACRLIGRAICRDAAQITMHLYEGWVEQEGAPFIWTLRSLDAFAERDGFDDWDQLRAFWRATHGRLDMFSGLLIRWTDFAVAL